MAQVSSCSAVSQKPCLFSDDRSAYPQRLCYPCSPDLRPQHFLCFCFQELEKLGLGDSVDLHVYEIPVEYQTVQRLIPALWEKHSPQVSGAKVSGVKGRCFPIRICGWLPQAWMVCVALFLL